MPLWMAALLPLTPVLPLTPAPRLIPVLLLTPVLPQTPAPRLIPVLLRTPALEPTPVRQPTPVRGAKTKSPSRLGEAPAEPNMPRPVLGFRRSLRKKLPAGGAKYLAKNDWKSHVNYLPDASPLLALKMHTRDTSPWST
mgnify:CR=1 FL=1